MKVMKHDHDLYLKWDVLLLPENFDKFRNYSLKNYGLSWNHFFSAPSHSWDSMLKMTEVVLVLIPDPDNHILFEKR